MTLRVPLARGRFMTLRSVYAPTLDSSDEDKDAFFTALRNTLQHVPRTDKILLAGDFNARVGSSHLVWRNVSGRHGVGSVNSNGLRLLDLCSEFSLCITNTMFQLPNKYKMSWMHPRSKHWHLIDYIIVRRTDLQNYASNAWS